MEILWIINKPIGLMRSSLGLQSEEIGGSWLVAALNNEDNTCDHITLATTWKCKKMYSIKGDPSFFVANLGLPFKYKAGKSANIKAWSSLFSSYSPDVIHIWGTEYEMSLDILSIFPHAKSVVYIQGILSSIAKHYEAGLSYKTQIKIRGIQDWYKINPILSKKTSFIKRSETEKKLLLNVNSAIVENTWCESVLKSINPELDIYKSLLPIKDEFFEKKWDSENFIPYTILCNSSVNCIKGLHILLRSFSIVLKKYPSAKLKIPGGNLGKKSFNRIIRKTGYEIYCEKLIKKLQLQQNVEFLGWIPSSADFAHTMSTVNVFVMPSSVENHSSTLIEAMCVGVPCIASDVGGVLDIIENGKNGYVYRFEEYELLAFYIIEIFTNHKKCKMISEECKKVKQSRLKGNQSQNYHLIYELLSQKN